MTIKYLDAKRIRGSSTADALKSARFDGVNDNAISADALGISLGNNYSFGGWANPEAQSSSIGMALYMAGTLYLYRTSGVWKTEGNGISITGSIDVGVDSWKHVMVNVVNGTATLYVDGVADGTDANTTSSTTITRIQMGEEGTSYEYKGNLSDWFFYSRALTTAEIASLSGGAQVSSISQTNLEANYTFDSNLNDRSSNSRHLATVTGDVTGGNTKGTSPTGIDEKATLVDPYGTAEFDGSGDYARVNNSVLNNVTDDWTIAMWYKTDDLTTGDAVIGCYTTGGSAGWQIYQKENNLIISDSTNHARNNLTFTTGTWYHIAWVCTSGTLQMFVDGVVSNIALATGGGSYGSYAASQSYGHELDSPDNTLNFGQRGDNDKYFDGRLQDAGFWTRALSSADIVLLAAGTPIDKAALATTYTTGLQGYFKFDGDFNSEVNSYTGTASGNATTATSGGKFNNVSNLPENTLFEETDTYKTYWLQDNTWALSTPSPLNMTYANSTAADAVWVTGGDRTTGEGIIKIDTTNNYLKDYWDSTTGTYRLSSNTYDLGSSLGTTWTVQFTVNFSNWRDPTSSNYVWGMGMWGSPSSSSMNTSQDRLACFVDNSSAYTIWNTSGATASGDGSMGALQNATGTTGSPSAVPSASTNSKDWFVTLQKVDTTKYTVVVREDSHAGTIIGARKEQTWQSGTPSGFRYFGAKCTMSNSARTGMIIKDVLVYDGALVGSI